MYLTRVYLNPYRRGCKFLISSPQRMHAAVLASFPPGSIPSSSEGRVLWRIDRPPKTSRSTNENSPAIALYISSPVAPDPAAIVEQAGYEVNGSVVVKRTDDFLDSLREGQLWSFRVTVNPTFRRAGQEDEKGRKKVLAHVTVAQQTQWFLDRAVPNGFEIPLMSEFGGDVSRTLSADGGLVGSDAPFIGLVERRSERFRRNHDERVDVVALQLATFEGKLRVTDPDLLRHALVNGIGRAKGYGAGLLSLAQA